MKKTVGLLISLVVFLLSCNKDKELTDTPSGEGYWKGIMYADYPGSPGTFFAHLNISDGSSILYLGNLLDTSLLEKYRGSWRISNNTYEANYESLVYGGFHFTATPETPYSFMEGYVDMRNIAGYFVFKMRKQE